MVGVRHRIGGYRVIAPIGAGGFATVYRALDEETGREMAIKVLAENHSFVPDTRRRFEEEMGLLSTVRSPSIAKIYKVGETDAGQPYMVLELADRGDLRKRLEEIRSDHRVLNRADLTILAKHLHDSLRTLHDMEIVHRDVSPGNILIRSHRPGEGELAQQPPNVTLLEPGEKLLLTDLGHAKDMILASGFTAGGGTRGFASPEQQDDVTVVDHRADIFAATAILEWVTVDGEYADGLEPFFDIGLAAEPDDRFDSMAEWHREFVTAMAAADAKRRGHHSRRISRLFRRTGAVDDSKNGSASVPNLLVAAGSPVEKTSSTSPLVVRPPKAVQPPNTPGATGIVRPPSPDSVRRFIVPPPDGAGGIRVVIKPPSGPGIGAGAGIGVGAAAVNGTNGMNRTSRSNRLEPDRQDEPGRVAAVTSVSHDGEYVYGGAKTAAADRSGSTDRDTKRPNRRRTIIGGLLTVTAITAIGLAQELSDSTTFFGLQIAAEDTVPVAVPMEDQSGVAGLVDQPQELVVTTDPAAPESAIEALSSPRANIGLPADGVDITGDLTVEGTATRVTGSDTVKLSIRNLDTLLYWNAETGRFGLQRSVVELEVAELEVAGEADGTPSWSTTVPADQLESGLYLIQAWVRGEGSPANPQDDSHRVVVP